VVTSENDPSRRQAIGARINAYNQELSNTVLDYDRDTNRRNPRGVEFRSDWQGSAEADNANTSIGAVLLTADDIDGVSMGSIASIPQWPRRRSSLAPSGPRRRADRERQ
jgi:hypothetical protein